MLCFQDQSTVVRRPTDAARGRGIEAGLYCVQLCTAVKKGLRTSRDDTICIDFDFLRSGITSANPEKSLFLRFDFENRDGPRWSPNTTRTKFRGGGR